MGSFSVSSVSNYEQHAYQESLAEKNPDLSISERSQGVLSSAHMPSASYPISELRVEQQSVLNNEEAYSEAASQLQLNPLQVPPRQSSLSERNSIRPRLPSADAAAGEQQPPPPSPPLPMQEDSLDTEGPHPLDDSTQIVINPMNMDVWLRHLQVRQQRIRRELNYFIEYNAAYLSCATLLALQLAIFPQLKALLCLLVLNVFFAFKMVRAKRLVKYVVRRSEELARAVRREIFHLCMLHLFLLLLLLHTSG